MARVKELLGNRGMADKHAGESEGNLGDGGLQENVAHWAEVLDRWVRGIDARLGRLQETDRQPPTLDGHSRPSGDEIDADPGAER